MQTAQALRISRPDDGHIVATLDPFPSGWLNTLPMRVIQAVANRFPLGVSPWRTARFSKELGHHTQSSETSRPACIIQQASRETK